jgi:hypothetical protein
VEQQTGPDNYGEVRVTHHARHDRIASASEEKTSYSVIEKNMV